MGDAALEGGLNLYQDIGGESAKKIGKKKIQTSSFIIKK